VPADKTDDRPNADVIPLTSREPRRGRRRGGAS
jgi:hypothetical protein